jgi:periplasmic protein CpxP/Spy
MILYKSMACVSFLYLLTFSLGVSAAAQTSQPADLTPQATTSQPATSRSASAGRRAQYTHRRPTIDDRVKDLAKALDLNDTQQAGVKSVLERQQLQARQIQFDQTIAGAERIGRFRALQEDTVLRIRALLNDEQKKKYDPLNHGTQNTTSTDSYVGQWMKNHQQPTAQHAQPSQK